MRRARFGPVFQPDEFIFFIKLELICLLEYLILEGGRQRGSHGLAFDDKAQLGIKFRRPRVKIEGTDKNSFAVHRKCFRVQAGAGTAERAGLFFGRVIASLPSHLEQFHALPQ